MRRRLVEFTLMTALLVVVPSAWADRLSQPADDEPSDVATVWFDTLYEVGKSEATAFPEASRIYGVSAVALYEARARWTTDRRWASWTGWPRCHSPRSTCRIIGLQWQMPR